MRRKYLIAGIIFIAVIVGASLYFMRGNAEVSDIFLKRAFKGQKDEAGSTIFEDKYMLEDQADEIEEDMYRRRSLLARHM